MVQYGRLPSYPKGHIALDHFQRGIKLIGGMMSCSSDKRGLVRSAGSPVVEVHGGGKRVMGVHDRADAACKEGHSVLCTILFA